MNRFEWLKAVAASDVSDRAKAVATILAIKFCNDETGQLDPGTEAIASASGRSVDSAKRALRDLINAGWLARTEGRGRGNKTEYTLLSPGKVVAIFSAKKGASAPLKKGCSSAPSQSQKGAVLPAKGCSSALSHNKDEQTLEQKAGAPDRWRNHRFTGRGSDGAILVPSSDFEALGEWGRWLREHGLPALSEFPIKRPGQKRGCEYFALPWTRPPTDAALTQEALAYFNDLLELEGPRHAAM